MTELEPTPLRLRRAREEGDSPIAPALGRLVAVVVAGLGASGACRALASRFHERLRLAAGSVSAGGELEAAGALAVLWDVAWISGPLLAAAAASVVVVGLAQTGGVVRLRRGRRGSGDGIWKGLPSLRDAEPWATTGRGALTLAGLVAVALHVVLAGASDIAEATGNPSRSLSIALELAFRFFALALVVLVASAALDVVIRRRAWHERWRLSPHEARRERRDAESPEAVRDARRRAREELTGTAPKTRT